MWEFFSTYGMTALLVMFLIQSHGLDDKNAYLIFGSYMALLHSSPLIAAYFTSRKFSYEYSVIVGGLLMAIGHFTIALPNIISVYISLSFMISGYGLFTPSLIALAGQITTRRSYESKFTLFYVGQNIGSFLAPITCGFIGFKFGWQYGFMLGGVGMLTGLFVFSKMFDFNNLRVLDKRLIYMCGYIILSMTISYVILYCNIVSSLLTISTIISGIMLIRVYFRSNEIDKANLLYVLLLMIFMTIFFAMLSQGGTSIVLFIDRVVNKYLLNFEVPGPSLLSIESLLMILISPIFFAKKQNAINKLRSIDKYILGLLLMSIAFVIFKNGAFFSVNTSLQCSMLFVAGAFLLFALAELLIMPIGYAEITKYMSKANLSLLLAIFGLLQAIARFAGQIFASYAQIQNYDYTTSLPDTALVYGNAFFMFSKILFYSCIILLVIRILLRYFVSFNIKQVLINQ